MEELPMKLAESHQIFSEAQPLPPWTVIFVLGGAGSGKGTQCFKLAASYNIEHLSIGELCREEMANEESPYASIIRQNIAEGRVGAPEMTLAILKNAMLRLVNSPQGAKAFLIDGFPRSLDRAILFEETICAPAAVLLLDCSEQIQQERLLLRASTSGRSDDSIEVIQKRFRNYTKDTMPVLEHYKKQGKLEVVDASEDCAMVYGNVQAALGEILVSR